MQEMSWETVWEKVGWKGIALLVLAGVVATLLFPLVTGTYGEPPPSPEDQVAEEGLPMTALPPEAILVSVNGETLTRRQFDATLSLYGRLLRMQRPSLPVWDSLGMALSREGRVIPNFIHYALFRQEAERRGIVLGAEEIAEASRRVLDGIQRSERTLAEVTEEIGGEAGALFYGLVMGNAWERALCVAVGGDALAVTEEDIDEAEKEATESVSREALQERLARERMGAVRRELAARLYDEATVEYPSGTNLFSRPVPSRPPERRPRGR